MVKRLLFFEHEEDYSSALELLADSNAQINIRCKPYLIRYENGPDVSEINGAIELIKPIPEEILAIVPEGNSIVRAYMNAYAPDRK